MHFPYIGTRTSINAIADVTVDKGTTADKLGLPAKVTVSTSDNKTAQVAVTWDTTGYDGTKAGTYTLSGALTMPEGITNPQNLKASVKVIVKEAAAQGLQVNSVSAVNLKEVSVVFNQTVEKTSAEKVSNYTISGIGISKAVLSDDGKTVTLTVSGNMTNNQSYNLSVNYVKDSTGANTISSTTKSFVASDVNFPTLVSAVATSSKTIKLTFSEPLGTAPIPASLLIDNVTSNAANLFGTYTVTAGVVGDKEFTYTTSKPIPVGEHTIVVNSDGTAKDYAGLAVPTTSQKINVAADTTAPLAQSASAISQTEANIIFNKEVLEGSVTAVQTNFLWNNTGSLTGGLAATTVTKVDPTTYKVTFSGANAMAAGNDYIVVPAGITDLAGNPVASKAVPITVVADAAPVVNTVSTTSGVIAISFNKAMDTNTATTSGNYVLKDSANNTISLAGAVLSYDSTNKQVNITGLTLTDTSYTITMTGIKDNIGNVMATTTKPFTNTPNVAPSRIDAARLLISADGAGKDVVYLPFDTPVATTGVYSALNAAKWTVGGAALTTTYPLATIDINPADSKEVRIHLNAAMTVAGGDDTFSVSNIASSYGTIQTAAQNYSDITAGQAALDIATGGATSIKLLDNKTIELKLNRKLSGLSGYDFAVKSSIDGYTADITTGSTANPIASATYANTTTGSTITFVMTNALDTTKSYRVATKASVTGTLDLDGLALATGKTYGTSATLSFASKITGAYQLDTRYVVVKMDQPVSTLVSKDDFIVKVDGTAIAVQGAVDGTTAGAPRKANEIVLDMGAGKVPVTSTVTVSTVSSDFIQTESANGQKITPIAATSAITATNFIANSLTLVNLTTGTSGTEEIGDSITIKFNKAVDPTSVGYAAVNKQGDGSYKRTDASLVFAAVGGAGTDDTVTITMNTKNIGVINVSDVTGDCLTGGTVTADAVLGADGKSLTLTFTGLGTSGFANANYVKSTLDITPAVSDITSTENDALNSSVSAATTTKF
ncbi:Ig-like domain-containing protein [Heliobacterium mobile]|uniref:Ig-like domain-containing protein n=1 Tax=Heliobacterium mobile TaxID=28064 RepID=UPI0012D810F3|nr:Ig-like domain-containing protein [Heliobacterium mobile]